MSHKFASRCGIYCGECAYREKTKCPGCVAAQGTMFWGKCELALCSIDKGIEDCGQCVTFPCDLLKRYSFDKEHGDSGRRIRNLEAWKAEGFENWLKRTGGKE